MGGHPVRSDRFVVRRFLPSDVKSRFDTPLTLTRYQDYLSTVVTDWSVRFPAMPLEWKSVIKVWQRVRCKSSKPSPSQR